MHRYTGPPSEHISTHYSVTAAASQQGCTGTHDHRLNTFSPKSKVFLPVTASVIEHHWSHTLLVSTTGVTVALFIGQHHCQHITASIPLQVSLCHYLASPSKYLSLSVLIPGVTVPVFTRWRHSKHSSLSAYLTVKPLYHFSHAPREVGYIADHCHPPHHHHSQNSAI